MPSPYPLGEVFDAAAATFLSLEYRVGATRGALLAASRPADGRADARALSYLAVLDEYRSACSRGGRYPEAAAALCEVKRLRAGEAASAGSRLTAAQDAELGALASAQSRQLAEFSAGWEAFLSSYDDAAEAYAAGMSLRQGDALRLFQNACAEEVAQRAFRPSRELLGWGERAEVLAK